MRVHLKPELQERVDRAARENNSGASEYVQQLVEHYFDHDVWFREQVKKALDQLDRGEFLTQEEMGALESSRCSIPKCKFARSPAAGEDLFRIFEYIRQENPSSAERVVRTIFRELMHDGNLVHSAQLWG